jgi:predicted ferric reductase
MQIKTWHVVLFLTVTSCALVIAEIPSKLQSLIAIGSPAGIWLATLSALGVVAAGYKLLLYPFLASYSEHRIVATNPGAAALHMELEPVKRAISFEPGQFGFIRMKQVLAEKAWENRLTDEDLRGLTPLFYGHINPYGTFHLDLSTRLDINEIVIP